MRPLWTLLCAGILAACSINPAQHVAGTELTIVPPEGLPQSARTPVYPADRESLFEDLAHNVLFLCRRPDLQAAARLSETDCKRHVLTVKGGCKAEARERIAETSIASKQRYEREFKQFIDCLIPPTPSQAR